MFLILSCKNELNTKRPSIQIGGVVSKWDFLKYNLQALY